MNDPEYIDPKELQPGPILHKSLPAELLERIEAIYGVIGPYIDTTLEQFEIGFMRDVNPGIEVAIWCNITTAWLDYHEKYLDDEPLSDEE